MGKNRVVDNPNFTKDDYNTLRQVRTTLANLLSKFDKAEACGVNCEFLRSQRQSIDDQLAAIQQHFMSPPPR